MGDENPELYEKVSIGFEFHKEKVLLKNNLAIKAQPIIGRSLWIS